MERGTHINQLPDELLINILWRSSQPVTVTLESASNALCASLCPADKYIWKKPFYYDVRKDEETTTPVSKPPLFADAAYNLLIAAVNRRWRRLAKRHVTALLVKPNLVVSLRDLANAVACFANLLQLYLCDGSVENVDDAFLAHLASSCPKLTALHVGDRIIKDVIFEETRSLHPITRTGLDHFFRQCTQLEQLSIFRLHPRFKLPDSFFNLTRLNSVVLPNTWIMKSSEFTKLQSLASLRVTWDLDAQQLACLAHLPSLTYLAIHLDNTEAFAFANLRYLTSLEIEASFASFDLMFPSDSPCARLERLIINGWNELEQLPNDIGERLPCLREFTLERTKLDLLPEGFTALSCLERLTISHSTWFSSLPENFGDLPALETLVLHMLPLTHLPESLTQLSSLETLIMVGCRRIRELPANFSNLTALKTLCMVKLPHVRLPEGIEGLPSIEALFPDYVFQQLILPSSFTEVSSLTRLDVDLFTVDGIPGGIGNLCNLRQLHVHFCPDIAEIPESLTKLTNLEVLTVGLCASLSSVPKKFDGFTKLKRLELTGCELLTEAPDSLPLLLEELSLGSYEQVTSLPDISQLANIKKLSLNLVGVECGSAVARSLSRVQHLELVLAEDATEFLFPLQSLPQLRILKILGAGEIERLPETLGLALQQLRQLEIHDAAELRELPESISQLQGLTSLVVDAPKLTALPDTIGALTRLRELILAGCSVLQQFPDSVTQLACLHRLNAESTSIRNLPSGISQLTRLRTLTLHGCGQLEELPEDLTELKMLHYLGVYGCTKVLNNRREVRNDAILSMYGTTVESTSTIGF